MTNHVHLLLTPDDDYGVSLLMKNLNQRYVQHVNRTRKRTGGLWEGRYRASFVDREYYLMCCHRYIELNPVRARMVRHPGDYEWSSYRTNAEGMASEVIVAHPAFLELANGVADLATRTGKCSRRSSKST
jgi:putative transposase